MIKVKVSYQTEKELEEVLKNLEPLIESVKIKQGQQNGYKRAYIVLDAKKL